MLGAELLGHSASWPAQSPESQAAEAPCARTSHRHRMEAEASKAGPKASASQHRAMTNLPLTVVAVLIYITWGLQKRAAFLLAHFLFLGTVYHFVQQMSTEYMKLMKMRAVFSSVF